MKKKIITSLLIVLVAASTINIKTVHAGPIAVTPEIIALVGSGLAAAGITFAALPDLKAAVHDMVVHYPETVQGLIESSAVVAGVSVINMGASMLSQWFADIKTHFSGKHNTATGVITMTPVINYNYLSGYAVLDYAPVYGMTQSGSGFPYNLANNYMLDYDPVMAHRYTIVIANGTEYYLQTQKNGKFVDWSIVNNENSVLSQGQYNTGDDPPDYSLSLYDDGLIIVANGTDIRLCYVLRRLTYRSLNGLYNFDRVLFWANGVPISFLGYTPISAKYTATVTNPSVLTDDAISGYPAMMQSYADIIQAQAAAAGSTADPITAADILTQGIGVTVVSDPVGLLPGDVVVTNPSAIGGGVIDPPINPPGTGDYAGVLGSILGVLTGIRDGITGGFADLRGWIQAIPAAVTAPITSALNVDFAGSGELDYSRLQNIGLTTVFPFCIPFDFVRAFGMFSVTPQPPVFIMDMSGTVLNYVWVLDLGEYETLAQIIRWGVYILFFVGLMMSTRKFIRW